MDDWSDPWANEADEKTQRQQEHGFGKKEAAAIFHGFRDAAAFANDSSVKVLGGFRNAAVFANEKTTNAFNGFADAAAWGEESSNAYFNALGGPGTKEWRDKASAWGDSSTQAYFDALARHREPKWQDGSTFHEFPEGEENTTSGIQAQNGLRIQIAPEKERATGAAPPTPKTPGHTKCDSVISPRDQSHSEPDIDGLHFFPPDANEVIRNSSDTGSTVASSASSHHNVPEETPRTSFEDIQPTQGQNRAKARDAGQSADAVSTGVEDTLTGDDGHSEVAVTEDKENTKDDGTGYLERQTSRDSRRESLDLRDGDKRSPSAFRKVSHAPKDAPAVTFDVDLGLVTKIFSDSIPAGSDNTENADENALSTVSSKKAWYRITRKQTMREYNSGDDDDSYVRVSWHRSDIRKEVLKIVSRWASEDRIHGRTVIGARPSSTFGWTQASGSSQAAAGEQSARPLSWAGESLTSPRSPTAPNKRWSHAAASQRKPSLITSNPVAQFSWSTSPTTAVPERGHLPFLSSAATPKPTVDVPGASGDCQPQMFQPLTPATSRQNQDIRPLELQQNHIADVLEPKADETNASVPEEEDEWGEMVGFTPVKAPNSDSIQLSAKPPSIPALLHDPLVPAGTPSTGSLPPEMPRKLNRSFSHSSTPPVNCDLLDPKFAIHDARQLLVPAIREPVPKQDSFDPSVPIPSFKTTKPSIASKHAALAKAGLDLYSGNPSSADSSPARPELGRRASSRMSIEYNDWTSSTPSRSSTPERSSTPNFDLDPLDAESPSEAAEQASREYKRREFAELPMRKRNSRSTARSRVGQRFTPRTSNGKKESPTSTPSRTRDSSVSSRVRAVSALSNNTESGDASVEQIVLSLPDLSYMLR